LRDPDVCAVKYCGYTEPRTPEELEFEILGLETAIFEAKKRIATLKQTNFLVKEKLRENENDNSNCQKEKN
jgi:hypothetical protein